MMSELVSEQITPRPGTFDAVSMASGVPGLPSAFTWRGDEREVVEVLSTWKQSAPEVTGEIYLRRHYFKLRMDDDSTWTIYFVRQTPRSGNPKARWFLYTRDISATGAEPG